MGEAKLLIISEDVSGPPGAVHLLIRRIADYAWRSDTAIEVCASDKALDYIRAQAAPSSTVVFVQSEGTIDPRVSMFIRSWIDAGAVVVELNVFNLPASDRQLHPRYIPAFYTWDGFCRHVIRARFAGHRSFPGGMILSNPQMQRALTEPKRLANDGVVRLLRMGRPDPRKWTDFEITLLRRLGKQQGHQFKFELTLVGAPDIVLRHADNLPRAATIKPLPYSNDVKALYQSADVYVHYSRIGETYGHSVLDASAFGLPVILGLDPSWDTAPLEYLAENESNVVLTPQAILRQPPDISALLQRSVATTGLTDAVISMEQFVRRLLNAASPQGVQTKAPTLRVAIQHIHRTCLRLGAGPTALPRALALEAGRSVFRRSRGL